MNVTTRKKFSLDTLAKALKSFDATSLTSLFSTYKAFTIEDSLFTPNTIITCYSEKVPYVSPNDDDYNNRPWELT